MAALTVHSGPFGRCPDCKKLTLVRINSLTHPVTLKEWNCDADLLRTVLRSVKDNSSEGKQYVKKRVPDPNDATKTINKEEQVTCMLAHCSACKRVAQRLYWMELNGGLSPAYCKFCLARASRLLEDDTGQIGEHAVYSYSTSILSVQQAQLVAEVHFEPTAISDDGVQLF
jgi:hypothetical protein